MNYLLNNKHRDNNRNKTTNFKFSKKNRKSKNYLRKVKWKKKKFDNKKF